MTQFAVILSPLALLFFFSPGGRLLLNLAAALVVFSPGYAPISVKLVFLGILGLTTAVSVIRLRHVDIQLGGGLKAAYFGYASALLLSVVVGSYGGVEATLQNILPYLLLLLILPIAIDAGAGSDWRLLESGLVITGLVSAVSFSVQWLSRRHISSLDADQLLAASMLMPAVVFQWGLVMSGEHSRAPWVRVVATFVSIAIPVAFLVTGTRTSVVFLLGLAFYFYWVAANQKRRALRSGMIGLLGVACSLPALGWIASLVMQDPEFLSKRIASIQGILSHGSASDASLRAREMATDTALAVLDGHWLFGLGMSTPKPYWVYAFDTPLLTVMRLGVIGTLLLVIYVSMILRWVVRVSPEDATGTCIRGIAMGWAMIVVGFGIFISPVDDPLFVFALGGIVALAVCARKREAILAQKKSAPLPCANSALGTVTSRPL